MNDHCNACEWQRITNPKWGGVQGNTIEHSHTYCTVPRSSQCPVTNGSVLDFKDQDAVRQEQGHAYDLGKCRYCDKPATHITKVPVTPMSTSGIVEHVPVCDGYERAAH
ncbi:hypothetical protein LCGC14_0316780 [marine sediment metagenome]|uniref:Uncharacterized protein n=1 Tax=marine sediment metagenome TaxID=412755 RepID=A0A0F9W7Z4_9ZZZZ